MSSLYWYNNNNNNNNLKLHRVDTRDQYDLYYL